MSSESNNNLVTSECKKCNSILKFPEDKKPERCGACGSNQLEIIGYYYDFETKEKALKILKDPELFNKITEQEFDKKIVGEIGSRKVIFLCSAGGRLVKNCQIASYNILVNDEAGSGKDYVTSKVLEILPKEYMIHKTRISPTVFTYWHNAEKEPEWTWDGKVFYPEDISETVLNSDVFKVMASSGSSATIIVKQQAVDLEIVGKPVMITTTATSTPNPELIRRFVILNLDSSEEQTRAIIKRHCEYAKTGAVPKYERGYMDAMRILERIMVQIPFADLLSEVLPTKSIIMRTHLPRFLDYIKASTAFHQFQRKQSGDFYLAEGQDYDLARECFLKLTSNKYMIPLTKTQKNILFCFEKNPQLKGHVKELNTNHMKGMAYNTLKDHLDKLVSYGILQSYLEKDSLNRDTKNYCLDGAYHPNEKISLPTFEELCRISETSETSETTKITETTETIKEKTPKEIDVSAVSVVSGDLPKNNLTPFKKNELKIEDFSDD